MAKAAETKKTKKKAAKKAPAKKAAAKKAAKKTPAKKAAGKRASAKKAPAKKTPAKKAAKKTPAKKAAKKTPAKKAPAEKPAAKKAPAEKAPAEKAPKAPAAANGTAKHAKLLRALQAALPMGTSRRIAEAARVSVWAISSEKTVGQFQAAEDLAKAEEAEVFSHHVDPADVVQPTSSARRSSRDAFAFFRAELLREERDDDPNRAWRAANDRQRHELLAGSTGDELDLLETNMRIKLPPSYYDFSLEWSGGELFVREYGVTRVVRAQELFDEVRGPLYGRMARPFLPVVELGCGDYLAMDTSRPSKSGEFPLFWWFEGQARRKAADSFAQWLRKLVEFGGEPFWWGK